MEAEDFARLGDPQDDALPLARSHRELDAALREDKYPLRSLLLGKQDCALRVTARELDALQPDTTLFGDRTGSAFVNGENHKGVLRVSTEFPDRRHGTPQKFFDAFRGAVSDFQPDDLWRRAVEKTPLVEVRILGDDGEAVVARKCPHCLVISALKPH